MTENQEKQMMAMLTKCVNGIQDLREDVADLKTGQAELKSDVAGLKSDVAGLKSDVAGLKSDAVELKEGQAELKEGQARLEKEIQITNKALSILADDSVRTRARVDILEQQKELSN